MRLSHKLLSALQSSIHRYVPSCPPTRQSDINHLQEFISSSNNLFVLTGAGLSTESGIPDYRSEKVGLYARTNHRPVQHGEFVKNPLARQRYWARNYVGWPQFANLQPNICHDVLSEWERADKVNWLVTQNVDALHAKAGSSRVTELHGCSHRVLCLQCGTKINRAKLQDTFKSHNPTWHYTSDALAPDGDVILTQDQVKDFIVPDCAECGGVLKPEVTFFGDNVCRTVVNSLYERLKVCDSMLVVGSSLFVYSGYRFTLHAAELGLPIAILNIGETRADHLASLKIEAQCGEVLPYIKQENSHGQ